MSEEGVTTLIGVIVGWLLMIGLILRFDGDVPRAIRWFCAVLGVAAATTWVLA